MVLDEARKNKQNKMKKRFIFRTIVLAILLAAVVFALVTNLNQDKEVYQVGDKAPDFELVQINKNN